MIGVNILNFKMFLSIILIVSIIIFIVAILIYVILKKKTKTSLLPDINVEDIICLKNYYSLEYSKNSKLYSALYVNIDMSCIENHDDKVFEFSFYREILEIVLRNLRLLTDVKISHIDDKDFLMLTHSPENQFVNACENINSELKNVLKKYNMHENRFVYIGMYSQKDIKVSFDLAVENAKFACFNAKSLKKPYKICNYDLFDKLNSNKKLEKNVINAVEHKDFTIKLYPYKNLFDECNKMYEAHKRLMRPLEGLAIPSDIHKIISDNELDMQFEYLFFNKVCEIIKKFEKEGIEDKIVACRFSKTTLSYYGFPQHIKLIVDNYKVDYTKIAIVVSENVFSADKTRIISSLSTLKNIGFKIFIDKYDTSYISHYDLQNFLVDMLIIDKDILFNQTSNTGKIALENIIDLAKSLDIPTTCDGICKIEQENIAKEYGCDYAKGIIYKTEEKIKKIEDLIKYE